MTYYFQVPFGASGDRTNIPVPTQPDGSESYTKGYTPNYSAPRDSDPTALTISREQFNQLMYAITSNIQQYQQFGVPEFITSADNGGSPFSYAKYARVRYDNGSEIANYVSLIASNTSLPTDASKWSQERTDVAYVGVANVFTQIQTINAAGTPLVLQSSDSTAVKISLKDGATVRGGIGATSAWSFAAYLSNLTTAAGGWDASGNLIPGAAATYDLGSASAQFRSVFANRYEVMGATAPTNGFYLAAANTIGFAVNGAAKASLSSSAFAPTTNDGAALGSGTLAWSDLFLAAGGVVNWNNGNVTLTHSTGALAFAGATNGYTFAGGPVTPAANDGVSLGTGALGFSDLFLADGGVINWNNGNATLTHSAGLLTSSVPITAPSINFTGSGVPANGLYLAAANTIGISTNTTPIGNINSQGINIPIGATTASTGRFTTVTSTIAIGTAPFTVTSTTRVANLNVANAGVADALSAIAANTVVLNATNASAVPTAFALANSTLLGRESAGNINAITLGTNLSMTGNVLNATGGGPTLGTATNLIGLTTINFTGIPSTAKIVFFSISGASSSSASPPTLRPIVAGSPVTSGYSWNYARINSGGIVVNTITTSMPVQSGGAGTVWSGNATFTLISAATNTWSASFTNTGDTTGGMDVAGGRVILSGTMTGIQLIPFNLTDTWSSGSANISWL